MSGEAKRLVQERREGHLVANRIRELHETPLPGNFDLAHLQAIHAHLFQDLPHHRPGVIRADSNGWNEARALEGRPPSHVVRYLSAGVAARIAAVLNAFGGPATLQDRALPDAAGRLAALYADLDHAHGFYEGNSRTLREFTRELALAAGYDLDWTRPGFGAEARNALYVARDVEVLARAYPGLTEQRAMATEDRAEYEAWWHLEALRKRMGTDSLLRIIEGSLSLLP